MENKKKWAIGYAVFCILYFAVSVAMPHDRLESRGLEGIGKPSLKLKTEAITDDTELRFEYLPDEQALSQLSFYFTADKEGVYTKGQLHIDACYAGTEEPVASASYDLADLGAEGFLGVEFEQEPVGQPLEIRITGEKVENGPCIWLNTETETAGSSYENGQKLDKNLIFNAVYWTQVHYVKKPFLGTLTLALLGAMFFLVAGKKTMTLEKKQAFGLKKKLAAAGSGIKAFSQKHRKLLGLGLLLFLTALLFLYVYDVQIRKAMNSTHREVVMKDNNQLLPVTKDSQDLIQYYTTEETELVGLGVRLDLKDDYAGEGSIHAEVYDVTEAAAEGEDRDLSEQGSLLCAADIDGASLLDGQYMGLIFDNSQKDTKGHTYEIKLHFADSLLDSGLSVIVTPEGYYPENTLLVNGEESASRLSMNAHTYFNLFLKKYFFGMFLFAECMCAGFYYLAFLRKCKIEKVFLFTILCLGVLYNFLITPYMTPDESYHIDMTYRHSNTLLGIESAGENKCYKRADDAELTFTSEPSLENYKNIYDGLLGRVKDSRLVEAEATSTTEAPMILYLPAVLGMTLARLLQLGTVSMYLLARWCSLLFFALMTYLGMKKLPFGKASLFLLAILPMNLQQCTSFSYDAVINGVIFLYICYCISLTWREDPVKPLDILVMGILSIVMIYGKSGVYLPVALLALLIPAKRFGGNGVRNFCLLALCLLPVLAFLNKNTVAVNYIATTTEATATVGSSTTAGYTLGYFLTQPLELVRVLANTVADKSSFYLMSLVGQKMGWVEIEISEVIPMLFLLLLILSALRVQGEPQYVKTGQKWWIGLVCAACAGIILAGMLLTWTPRDHISIEGVQGRYFIPFMPAFLLVLRNGRLTWNRPAERGLLYAGLVGQLLTVVYLIKAVLIL